MNKIDWSSVKVRRIILLIIFVLVIQLFPLAVKTRFSCDITDCRIEKKIFGLYTTSEQTIGRNQIVNFAVKKNGRTNDAITCNIFMNTTDASFKYKLFRPFLCKNARKILNEMIEVWDKENIDITY